MSTCPVCGNDISPLVTVCPHCEQVVGRQAGSAPGKRAGKGGIRTLNIKEGMPTVGHALDRLKNGILSARKSGARVLKVIHGYGSGGTGGAIRGTVHQAAAELRRDGSIRGFYPGERFSRSEGGIRQEAVAVPALRDDTDLDRANPGITVILI